MPPDQETILESAADEATQSRAEALGWIPPAKFKGDAERYVDADEFIKRGETVLPIVKKQLETTREEFARFRTQSQATATALAELQEKQREADVRFAAEKQRAVDDAIRTTKAALAKATEAGDHEAAAELTGDLIELGADKKAAVAATEEAKKPPVETKAPDKAAADIALVQEWIADGNDWFKTDRRRQSLMQGIAMELREKGNTQTGKTFMNTCKAEMLKTLGESESHVDKVEGGRNGGGAEDQSRQSGKKSYNNLPVDAKAQCDKDGRAFVGPGKKYETQAAWRARYAEIYYERD